jgi:glutaredoxin
MSSVHPHRCPKHDLAVAPDGQCILCRREQGTPISAIQLEPAPSAMPRVLNSGLLVLLSVGLAGAAWATFGLHGLHPQPSAAVAIDTDPAGLASEEKRRADAAKAIEAEKQADREQLAASLRMLEKAEAERLERERLLAQTDLDKRTGTEAERKRQEQARDLERHQAIQHELDSVALTAARHKVSIAMYSTSWCGVCKQARAYMRQNSIAFNEFDVEHDTTARDQAYALNPRGSVPTFAVDDEVLIGFSPDSLETRITRAAKRRAGP